MSVWVGKCEGRKQNATLSCVMPEVIDSQTGSLSMVCLCFSKNGLSYPLPFLPLIFPSSAQKSLLLSWSVLTTSCNIIRNHAGCWSRVRVLFLSFTWCTGNTQIDFLAFMVVR